MADHVQTDTSREATRRSVLRGAVFTGAVIPALAACGADEEAPSTSQESTPDTGNSPAGKSTKTDKPSAGGGEVIASTDDVPEGGGLIVEDAEVVVTQPKAGTFLGFSSTCTHQGCQVTTVADGTINCPCHGSTFSIEDGSVVSGPATEPLAEAPLIVSDKEVILA